MEDRELMNRIKELKTEKGYTLHVMSNMIGVQIVTLERWIKTNRINRLYAQVVREKLNLH